MILKVINSFVDKYTGVCYPKDKELEVDEARGEELLANPYNLVVCVAKTEPQIEAEVETKEEPKPKKTRKAKSE